MYEAIGEGSLLFAIVRWGEAMQGFIAACGA